MAVMTPRIFVYFSSVISFNHTISRVELLFDHTSRVFMAATTPRVFVSLSFYDLPGESGRTTTHCINIARHCAPFNIEHEYHRAGEQS
ncbi:hypothetical protein ABKN59_007672 [Abortiporus biennis]